MFYHGFPDDVLAGGLRIRIRLDPEIFGQLNLNPDPNNTFFQRPQDILYVQEVATYYIKWVTTS